MSATRVELVSAGTGLDCADCGQPTRHAVLVNEHDLVLLRGRTCTGCGGRHRIEDLVPVPRKSA
ncbi:MAG TPA: hypothetical protein VH333_03825 [Pseudonocardiaceae bacterium]|jgi:hypothetical protein|nr:hypothetical protein [Pseudonocardiaceae bacterium]